MLQSVDMMFGEFLPDLPAFRNPGMTLARNCRPGPLGFMDLNGLSTVSNALDARVQGAGTFRSTAGVVISYAATATKLYQLTGITWTDSTGTANDIADDQIGEFAKFGETIIWSYYSTAGVEIQSVTMGNPTFANHIVSTRKPRFGTISRVRDFLFGGKSYDVVDGAQHQRLWWSAFGDSTDFTPNAVTQCDFQDLDANDGEIKRIVGRDYATVYMDKAIWRATYSPSDVFFQLDKMSRNRGCLAKGSVASLGRFDIFLDSDGMYLFDGTEVTNIGANKINKTLINELDTNYLERISAAIDPIDQMYVIAIPTNGSSGVVNRQYWYHLPTQKWSDSDVSLEMVFEDASKGISIDSFDPLFASIDVIVPNLDSRVWAGGSDVLGAFGTTHILGGFDGNALTARLETGEPDSGRKLQYLREIWPYVQGSAPTITVQVGARTDQSGTVTYSTAVSPQSTTGAAKVRTKARYQRVRLNIANGFDHAYGVRAYGRTAGMR